jgi:BirA family biotin operon repressor/biotin-[acetyl-CoA-carboxylase] ligase
MDQQILEKKLAGLHLGGIRYFETIGSTNDAAADWAERETTDCLLVVADEQTQGRGRSGRKWFTYPGSALAFSLVLHPTLQEQTLSASLTTRFTGLGSLGVSRALQNQYALPAQVKWPNDVLVNRRKLCGVLAEACWIGDRLSNVVLGIGINIATNAVPPADIMLAPATSVEAALGRRVDRLSLLLDVLSEILVWRSQLMSEDFLLAWEDNLAFRGEWVQIGSPGQLGNNATMVSEGRVLGLDTDGALRLQTHSGDEIVLRSSEIHLTTARTSRQNL